MFSSSPITNALRDAQKYLNYPDSYRAELDAIAWKLNTHPRKSPGFKCLVELFMPDAFDFKLHHAALFALGA